MLTDIQHIMTTIPKGILVRSILALLVSLVAIAFISWNVSLISDAYTADDSELTSAEVEREVVRLRSANATLTAEISNRLHSTLEERVRLAPTKTGVTIARYDQRIEKSRRSETLVYTVHLSGTYKVVVKSLREIESWPNYRIRSVVVSQNDSNTKQALAKLEIVKSD